MINIQSCKPVKLLKTFESDELKLFGKFLKSGYISNSQMMIKLFNVFASYYPNFIHPKLNAIQLAKKLFPEDKTLKEQKLRKRLSEFSKLIFQFIAISELQNSPSLQEGLHHQFLLKKNNHSEFKKAIKTTLAGLDKNLERDTEFYQRKNKIFHLLYKQSLDVNFLPVESHLVQASENLDSYFYLKKLEYTCAALSIQQITPEEDNLPLNKTMLKIIKDKFSSDPVFAIYLQLIELKKQASDNELFNLILSRFKTQYKYFSKYQKKFILFQLLNYTFEQVKYKRSRFLKKQFELYEFGLEQELFLKNNLLSEKTFLNISVTAALIKQFDFINHLINKYSKKLPATECQKTIVLTKAFMAFHQGDFEKAYDFIYDFEESALHYKLRTRLLLLRCLYHMQIEDDSYVFLLENKIKSYVAFIKREKKLSLANKNAYLNFSTALKKIITQDDSISLNSQKKNWEIMINNFSSVIAKDWLLDIIKKVR